MTEPIVQATAPAPLPMLVKRRRPWLWAAITLPLAGWAALAFGAATPLKGIVERHATAALGRAVTVGGALRILVTPFSVTFTGEQVRIANPKWALADNFLDAGTVSARLATFDLLVGQPGLRMLAIADGTIDLERSKHANRINWDIGRPGTLFDATAIRRIDADHVAIHFRDNLRGAEAQLTLEQGGRGIIDLRGEGRIGERHFALTGTTRSAEGAPTKFDIRAHTDAYALAVRGEAETPFKLNANDLDVSARGADFAQLAALGGITLPAMPDYEIKAAMSAAPGAWHFSHVAGRIGSTDLTGKLTLDQRHERPRIFAELASRTLNLDDARQLFGIENASVATLDDEEGLRFVPRLLPDAHLSSEALRRFDAVVAYRADAVHAAPHAPAHLSMTLALVDGRLQVSPASVDLGGGFVSSDIFIDTRRKPALVRGDIRLSPTPMGRLLADWGIAPAGTTAMVKGRIQLTGQGDTLREVIGNANGRMALIIPGGMARMAPASASSLDMANVSDAMFSDGESEEQPTGIRCGLIAFTVREGLATADPILIDTQGHVLTGSGELDLRDERLDLRLSADGKAMTFFARPHPVRIGGTFSDPVLERAPVSWFGESRLFGLPLPSLGAIFGFVDPGAAQAPACGPILRGAPESAQRERDEGQRLASR
ncbi:AsmA family protein [Sphingobium nicotianae]|uniref:AsmA family protein n=1 Tax=Sphingobium nicotianae TaxID=2782607 RepID=A0A9X1DBC0_9SPHN|nr:AsmA family protein [Sphingobium nicotianae]MBT2186836.1 AsmA family protein [Sphingobium nicotianae]